MKPRQAARLAAVTCSATFLLLASLVEAHWRDHVTILMSDRLRWESVNWFTPAPGLYPPGAEDYDFVANQLRFGLRVSVSDAQIVVEGQHTALRRLPEDATRAAAPGNLGPGATYYQYNRESDPEEGFLRQASVTARSGGFQATLGRFEGSEGLETLPGDANLVWVKRNRIAERLLGPFGYTHAGRTLDGAKLVYEQPTWNVTGLAVRPTMGAFELSAGRQLEQVSIAGLPLGVKKLPWSAPSDGRAFVFRYDDARVNDGVPVRVDNRPAGVRAADSTEIAFTTVGLHAATVLDAGSARIDLLAWGAFQEGEWGRQDHSGSAYAFEAGLQATRVWGSPWLRVGWNRASGDDDPNDGVHGTFVPLLPTPRIYALTPFYSSLNLDDRFVQLIVRPVASVTVRADQHALELAEAADLWYSGGGAIRDDVFGYAGLPSSGRDDLGTLADVGVTWAALKQVTLYGYYGRTFGGEVIEAQFADARADYGYFEATYRW